MIMAIRPWTYGVYLNPHLGNGYSMYIYHAITSEVHRGKRSDIFGPFRGICNAVKDKNP